MKVMPDNYRLVFKIGAVKKISNCVKNTFELSVDHEDLVVDPGSLVKINVHVRPVGDFNDNVALSVNEGSINPREGKPFFEAAWELTAPKDPGDYEYHVKGASGDLIRDAKVIIRVKGAVESLCIDNISELMNAPDDYKLTEFELRDVDFDLLQLTRIRPLIKSINEARIKFTSGGTTVTLNVSNIDVDTFDQMIKYIRNSLGHVNTQAIAENAKFNVSGISVSRIKEMNKERNLVEMMKDFPIHMCFNKSNAPN